MHQITVFLQIHGNQCRREILHCVMIGLEGKGLQVFDCFIVLSRLLSSDLRNDRLVVVAHVDAVLLREDDVTLPRPANLLHNLQTGSGAYSLNNRDL